MLSVIIVLWNSRKYVSNCVKSVLRQGNIIDEIFIIDNNTFDDEISIVNTFNCKKINVIKSKKNIGFAKAQNIGINQSKSEWILSLNIDTILPDDYCKQVMEACQKSSDAIGIVGTRILSAFDPEYIDSDGIGITKHRFFYDINHGKKINTLSAYKNDLLCGICACAAFYRRKMIDAISYKHQFFDETFSSYYEDVDVSWRAANQGWQFKMLTEPVIYHFKSGTSKNPTKDKSIQYLTFRNRYYSIIKNDSLYQIFLDIPNIIQMEIYNLFLLLKYPHLFKAVFDVMLHFHELILKRKERRNIMRFSATHAFYDQHIKFKHRMAVLFRKNHPKSK
jgi:GT2 family glycosyltransferase